MQIDFLKTTHEVDSKFANSSSSQPIHNNAAAIIGPAGGND
jgi:hypothetical protein